MISNRFAVAAAARRRVDRQAESWQSRSWLFYEVGTRLKDNTGALYEVVAVNQEDRVVSIRKFVLDSRRQPIPGLREQAVIRAAAERDAVKVGRSCWARRVEEVERC
jgi:hypothetical protein